MFRLFVSLVVWAIFLAITSAIVMFGVHSSGYELPVTWENAMWIGIIIRLLFLTNQVYDKVRKELDL
jgi:hypothetical protein